METTEVARETLLAHGKKYFNDLEDRIYHNNKGKGIPPKGFSWEYSGFDLVHALVVASGKHPENVTREELKNVQNGEAVSVSDTSVDRVCTIFDFGRYGIDLVGKTVLDFGAGESDFGMQMNECWAKYGTNVYSFDLRYVDEPVSKKYHADVLDIEGNKKLIQFLDGADVAISLYLINFFNPAQQAQAIDQMLKCIKPGGVLKLAPYFTHDPVFYDEESSEWYLIANQERVYFPEGVSLSKIGSDIWTMSITKPEDAGVYQLVDRLFAFALDPLIEQRVGFNPPVNRSEGYYPSQIVANYKKASER